MNTVLLNKLEIGIPLIKTGLVLPWETPFESLKSFGSPELIEHSEQRTDLVWKTEEVFENLELDLVIMRWSTGLNKRLTEAYSNISEDKFKLLKSQIIKELGRHGTLRKRSKLEYDIVWKLKNCTIKLSEKDRFGTYWQFSIHYNNSTGLKNFFKTIFNLN